MRWIYSIALLALLLWGLEQVAVSPLETGDVYPPYSSLRSDPLGAKALYDSFAALPGIETDRLYQDRSELAANETMLVLGVDPVGFADLTAKELEEYEKLVARGGRLVIAFLPVRARPDHGARRPIEERWHVAMKYAPGVAHGAEPDDSALPRETAMYFTASSDWRPMGRHDAIERTFGRGSVVLVGDSFPLSNEGLRDARDAAFLAELAGSATHLIFDENHFGVTETGSVTTLLRKYRLEDAVAVLLLAALLFLWRSASSLLPPRSGGDAEAVAGRDSLDGMTALLMRGVAEKDLLNACFAEWSRSAPREPRSGLVEDQIRGARDPVQGYRAACRALHKETK